MVHLRRRKGPNGPIGTSFTNKKGVFTCTDKRRNPHPRYPVPCEHRSRTPTITPRKTEQCFCTSGAKTAKKRHSLDQPRSLVLVPVFEGKPLGAEASLTLAEEIDVSVIIGKLKAIGEQAVSSPKNLINRPKETTRRPRWRNEERYPSPK